MSRIIKRRKSRAPTLWGTLHHNYYHAILADPPWNFTWSDKGKGRSPKYSTMTIGEVCRLPVGKLVNEPCALFLWVTQDSLQEGLFAMLRWGFTFKTVAFVWVKPSIGLGYWTRKRCEFCLMGTIGKVDRLSKGIDEVIQAPRREHSRKPDDIYDRIEQLVPGPYCELFARYPRKGWDQWGDEL